MIVRFGTGRRGKFGNTKTIRAGQIFDSKREANRYDALKLLEANGEVRNIRRQVKYVMIVNGVRITSWKADFVYEELRKGEWNEIVEDSKGYPNDRWPLKKKLMKACHGIAVRES